MEKSNLLTFVNHGITMGVDENDRNVIESMKQCGWQEVQPEPSAAGPEMSQAVKDPGKTG